MQDWLQENYKAVLGFVSAGLAGGFGIRWLLDFAVKWRKTGNEAEHQSATSNLSTLQVSDQMAKDWMVTAKEATDGFLKLTRQLAESELAHEMTRRSLAEAEEAIGRQGKQLAKMSRGIIESGRLIAECIAMMKHAGIDTAELERRVDGISGVGE